MHVWKQSTVVTSQLTTYYYKHRKDKVGGFLAHTEETRNVDKIFTEKSKIKVRL
jgi:hypothetical protein